MIVKVINESTIVNDISNIKMKAEKNLGRFLLCKSFDRRRVYAD